MCFDDFLNVKSFRVFRESGSICNCGREPHGQSEVVPSSHESRDEKKKKQSCKAAENSCVHHYPTLTPPPHTPTHHQQLFRLFQSRLCINLQAARPQPTSTCHGGRLLGVVALVVLVGGRRLQRRSGRRGVRRRARARVEHNLHLLVAFLFLLVVVAVILVFVLPTGSSAEGKWRRCSQG